MADELYYEKYMKYKNKYVALKQNMYGYSQNSNLSQDKLEYTNKNKYLELRSSLRQSGGEPIDTQRGNVQFNTILGHLKELIKEQSKISIPVIEIKNGKPVTTIKISPYYFTLMRDIILKLKDTILNYKLEIHKKDKNGKLTKSHKKGMKIISYLKDILCENMEKCVINRESVLTEKDGKTPSINGKIIIVDDPTVTSTTVKMEIKKKPTVEIETQYKKSIYRYAQIKDLLKELSDIEQLITLGSIQKTPLQFDCGLKKECTTPVKIVSSSAPFVSYSQDALNRHAKRNVGTDTLPSSPATPTGTQPSRPSSITDPLPPYSPSTTPPPRYSPPTGPTGPGTSNITASSTSGPNGPSPRPPPRQSPPTGIPPSTSGLTPTPNGNVHVVDTRV
jgi:hypothetical protein